MGASRTFGVARWAGLYAAAAVLAFLGAAEIPLVLGGPPAETLHAFRATLFLAGAVILGLPAHIHLRRHERDGGRVDDDHPRP